MATPGSRSTSSTSTSTTASRNSLPKQTPGKWVFDVRGDLLIAKSASATARNAGAQESTRHEPPAPPKRRGHARQHKPRRASRELDSFSHPELSIADVAFPSEGGWLVAADSADGSTQVWDPAARREVLRVDISSSSNVALSSDGRYLAGPPISKGSLAVWNVPSAREVVRIKVRQGLFTAAARAVTLTREGHRVAALIGDTARVWEQPSGRELLQVKAELSDAKWAIQLSPLGTYLATRSDRYTAAVWEVRAAGKSWRSKMSRTSTALS
jgi:WD40 repeat protein